MNNENENFMKTTDFVSSPKGDRLSQEGYNVEPAENGRN